MADTIKQCWAYNIEGQRCEHPAGHPGNHVITAEWTDEECYSPIRHQLPQQPMSEPTTGLVTLVENKAPVEPAACVACNHHHRGGQCKCGCHEFIG